MVDTVKFVTAVGVSDAAHTRLDLTPLDPPRDYRRVQLGEGADWGWPQLATVYASGVGQDGDVPVASRYGNRTITLPIVYTDQSTADQRRAAVEALAAELDRDRNVLFVQPEGASEGRWLVTYRASQVAAELRTYGPTDAFLPVQLQAEPFAYGPLTTPAWSRGGPGLNPAVTRTLFGAVSADQPATEASDSASGGQWYRQVAAGGILGDVPAPAVITFAPLAGGTIAQDILVASRPVAVDDSSDIRYHLASGAGTFGDAVNTGNVGSAANDEARLSTASVTTGAYETVMYGQLPNLLNVPAGLHVRVCRELAGRWRILAKVRQSGAGNVWQCYAGSGGVNGTARTLTRVPVTVTSSTYQWVDLGVLQLPAGSRGDTAYLGDDPPVGGDSVALYAAKTSGASAGFFACDYMLAVPADGRAAAIRMPAGQSVFPGAVLRLDGDRPERPQVLAYSPLDNLYWADPNQPQPGYEGAVPLLYPGKVTQLFVVADYGPTPGTAAAVSVDVSYRPRYLSVV